MTRSISFVCRGCGTSNVNTPMLKNEVWAVVTAAYPRDTVRDLLCLECTEKALGRQVQLDDLMDCLGNQYTHIAVTRIVAALMIALIERKN